MILLPWRPYTDPRIAQTNNIYIYIYISLLLPVSLRLEDIGLLPLQRKVVSASLTAPPREDCKAIGGLSPERVGIPELGVAPLVDPDTDLEDELPTPEDSLLFSDSSLEGLRLLGVRPAPPDIADLELEMK